MLRNWSEYNEKLVKRGEFYLNPDFLESWDEELEEMNEGKVGRPCTERGIPVTTSDIRIKPK